jgi:hypothetical protein
MRRIRSGCCARPTSRAAECDQQFPPSDGDCHTPLPREVRKGNGTTPRACSLPLLSASDLNDRSFSSRAFLSYSSCVIRHRSPPVQLVDPALRGLYATAVAAAVAPHIPRDTPRAFIPTLRWW